MTLVLIDGMEDDSSFAGAIGTFPVGRYNNCLRQTGGSATYTVQPSQETDTFTFGAAFRLNGTGPAGGNSLIEFRSDAGATTHMAVWLNSNGSISVLRGVTTLATSAAGLFTYGRWYYIEFQAKLSDTVGTFTLRLDGAQIASGTAQDTKNAGTKTVFDTVALRNILGPSSNDWDDIYLMSGTGDSFLGSITVETLYPNANGNANAWIGSDGNSVNNYQLVDEVGTPNLVDYTYSNTIGQQDLYGLTDLVHTDGTIAAICHSAYMLRTDALTARNVKLVNRRSADTKSASWAIGTAWRSYEYCLTVDPEGGGPFSISNVNALQSGIELA